MTPESTDYSFLFWMFAACCSEASGGSNQQGLVPAPGTTISSQASFTTLEDEVHLYCNAVRPYACCFDLQPVFEHVNIKLTY